MADLLFSSPQPASTNLRFGSAGGGSVDYVDLTLSAVLPVVTYSASGAIGVDNAVSRGPKCFPVSLWWEAAKRSGGVSAHVSAPVKHPVDTHASSVQASPLPVESAAFWAPLHRDEVIADARYQDARNLQSTVGGSWVSLVPKIPPVLRGVFSAGSPISNTTGDEWLLLSRKRRPFVVAPSENGTGLAAGTVAKFSKALRNNFAERMPWGGGAPPPAGKSPHSNGGTVTPPKGCYTPPLGNAVNLLFKIGDTPSLDLLFRCQNTGPVTPPTGLIVVPVQRTYIVINSVHLRRVDGNLELPCYSLSMQLDRDSWTWGFTASLHVSAMPLIEPAAFGEPVEFDAEINGAHYRLFAEGLSRDRQFGSARISVSGRGRSAILSDPYSPILNFSNAQTRTAAQLIDDVLTDNGVAIGWEVDFGIADWSVPAGLFAHSGSYMSALKAITDSVGAYIQPDPVASKIYVKPAYPVLPWNLSSATPDFELPVDVTSKEGISWYNRPAYNSVYVSGTAQGVLALVRRQGTAGNAQAPMVVDNLITDDIAARQRGESILGNTGRIAEVTLELPVLAQTGIITPGKIVRYLDGGVSRTGISRSVSVNTNLPKVRQQIQVETHV